MARIHPPSCSQDTVERSRPRGSDLDQDPPTVLFFEDVARTETFRDPAVGSQPTCCHCSQGTVITAAQLLAEIGDCRARYPARDVSAARRLGAAFLTQAHFLDGSLSTLPPSRSSGRLGNAGRDFRSGFSRYRSSSSDLVAGAATWRKPLPIGGWENAVPFRR